MLQRRAEEGLRRADLISGACLSLAMLGLSITQGLAHPLGLIILAAATFPLNTVLASSVNSYGERGYTILYCLYMLALLIFPGMLHCSAGVFPFFRKDYGESEIAQASSVCLAFSVLSSVPLMMRGSSSQSISPHGSPTASINTGRFASLVLFLLGLSIVGFFGLGGPAHFFSRLSDHAINRNYAAINPWDQTKETLVRTAGFLTFAVSLVVWRMNRGKLIWLPVIGVLFATALCLNFPQNITRFLLAGYSISLIITLVDMRTRKAKGAFLALYGLGVLTLFPALSNLSRGDRGAELFENPLTRYTTSGDYDGLQSTINVVDLVQSLGISWGNHLLSAIFAFIPRAAWPTKATATGSEAAAQAGYSFVNISAPLPAEAYRDFGWPGVIVGGYIIGAMLVRLDRSTESARASGRALTVLVHGTVIGLLTIILRGPLIGISAAVEAAVLITLACALFIQGRAPTPRISRRAVFRSSAQRLDRASRVR